MYGGPFAFLGIRTIFLRTWTASRLWNNESILPCAQEIDSAFACLFYRAGITMSKRHQQNLARLQTALTRIRLWPTEEQTAVEFAKLYQELRSEGRMLSQFDLLIAAMTRQHDVILLTADQDFQPVSKIKVENWL